MLTRRANNASKRQTNSKSTTEDTVVGKPTNRLRKQETTTAPAESDVEDDDVAFGEWIRDTLHQTQLFPIVSEYTPNKLTPSLPAPSTTPGDYSNSTTKLKTTSTFTPASNKATTASPVSNLNPASLTTAAVMATAASATTTTATLISPTSTATTTVSASFHAPIMSASSSSGAPLFIPPVSAASRQHSISDVAAMLSPFTGTNADHEQADQWLHYFNLYADFKDMDKAARLGLFKLML